MITERQVIDRDSRTWHLPSPVVSPVGDHAVVPLPPDLHSVRLFVREPGPYAHRPQLLEDELFWWGHLSACLQEGAPRSWLGKHDPAAEREFGRRLWDAGDRPVFTVPLSGGVRLHVVYENAYEDASVDYVAHHPAWEEAEFLARDSGHWRGPGLSWSELTEAADNALPGGTTTDPDTRLLLLLPALGDADLPQEAGKRLAAVLRDRLGAAQPGRLAALILRRQGMTGPARWSTGAGGVRVNDGQYSFRNPDNRDALPDCRLAQLSGALNPAGTGAPAGLCVTDGPSDGCRAEPRSVSACPRRDEYTRWLEALMSESSPPF
ncbi:hypothetical protein ACFXMF_32125 [Embleya sp. NPDC059213]|uniref:hypothetical protein n=1 Tax=Embleya sp. NPDC059213 TaxID=3346771 RepID=UPI0036927117